MPHRPTGPREGRDAPYPAPVAVSWILFPLVLGVMCLGCGLLVERASGDRLPGELVLPVGFAALVALAGLPTMWSTSAPLTTPLVVAAAVAGIVLAARDGRLAERRPGRGPGAAALGVFAVYALPLVATGQKAFGGYIKLDDTASWLNITDHVMSHGRSLGCLAPSSYQANLDFYLSQTGYPIGSFLPLGVGHQLLGWDSAWLFQPYETLLAALLALALYGALAGAIEQPAPRALIAWLAAQPALLLGYALWGGVKEMAAAVLVPLVVVLLVRLLRPEARPREAVGLAVVCGALFGVLGLGAGPWLAPALVGALVVLVRRRRGARLVAAFAAPALVLSVPALAVAGPFIRGGLPTFTGDGFSSRYANLYQPLSPFQLGGIWPSGDFRIPPDPIWPTALLLIAALGVAGFGAWRLWRSRAWTLLVYPAAALAACAIIGAIAQPWLVAKAFAQAAPAIVLLALAGAALLIRARRLRPLGIAAALVVAGGVLWSNVLAYTQVTPTPAQRFAELESLGHRIAGQGPTLVTEPEIYADRHFLRAADPEVPGDLRVRRAALSGGETLNNGAWADIDAFFPSSLTPYDTLVIRRSPVASRPPFPYRLVHRGRWYETWQRPGRDSGGLVEHVGLGDNFARPYCGKGSRGILGRCGIRPAAPPRCAEVRRLARSARLRGASLRAVPRENPVVLESQSMRDAPSTWGYDPARSWLTPTSAGTVRGSISVPRAGRYEAWLGGSFGRPLEVSLDGRRLGSAEWQLSNYGQFAQLRSVSLAAGALSLLLRGSGPGVHPGSAESRPDFNHISSFVLAPAGADRRAAVTIAPSRARVLCGQSLDWVEVVR